MTALRHAAALKWLALKSGNEQSLYRRAAQEVCIYELMRWHRMVAQMYARSCADSVQIQDVVAAVFWAERWEIWSGRERLAWDAWLSPAPTVEIAS